MARAHSVWIVVEPDYDGDHIQAAFTVKHECVSWLRQQADNAALCVQKVPDGRPGDAWGALTPAAEFLAANG